MSYDDLDAVAKRALQEAEYMRSNEAKLAQLARIKQLTAYTNWLAERGDWGDPNPTTEEDALKLLHVRRTRVGYDTMQVLDCSFVELYEHIDAALENALAWRDYRVKEWAAESDIAELNALWEWLRERLPADYVSPY
ncbi:TPA: hypothetical protein ACIADP_001605 [Escherichia coli]|uniref:hypothetical protein n=1 Tax=Escherichia coli TaxID=562 RepID=UPI000D6A4D22|nr:hypothetical protein [Escherichia coli]